MMRVIKSITLSAISVAFALSGVVDAERCRCVPSALTSAQSRPQLLSRQQRQLRADSVVDRYTRPG